MTSSLYAASGEGLGGAGSPPGASPSPAPTPRPRELVDVHAHFVPEAFRAAAEAAGHDLTRRATFAAWSLDEHLALADVLGVAMSVLSLPAPGVHLGDGAQAVALARIVNDEAAALVARSPERLRFFAALPLPDVTGALAEWQRASSLRGCVGAVLYAQAGDLLLGDVRLDPLLGALNEVEALVLVHPQLPAPGAPADLSLEAAVSVTRAAMGMFESRMVTRFSKARFILAGVGGILPGVLDRIQSFGLAGYTIAPNQTRRELAGLYFDCAGAVLGTQLRALLEHVSIARVLYGSDSGSAPLDATVEQSGAFDRELDAAPGKPLRAHWLDNGRALALDRAGPPRRPHAGAR